MANTKTKEMTVKALGNEKNEELEAKAVAWARIRTLLENDENAIRESFCLRVPGEGQKSFNLRKEHYVRTFVNFTQGLVTAPVDALYKKPPKITSKEGSIVSDFMKNVTRSEEEPIPLDRYFKDYMGMTLRAFGVVFVVLDRSDDVGDDKLTEKEKAKPYISMIRPEDVVDWDIKNGEFQMFKYRVTLREEWVDYMEPAPGSVEYEYTWTKEEFIKREVKNPKNVTIKEHSLGKVPVVVQATFKTDNSKLLGSSTMEQTSNMILSYNDYLHLGGHELKRFGGATLLMPEDAQTSANVHVDETGEKQIKKQDNDNVLEYRGKEKPTYLIKEVNTEEHLKYAKIYYDLANENERDQKSVAKKGSDGDAVAESGVAKVIERDPLENNIVSFAQDGDSLLNKILDLVAEMCEEDKDDSSFEFSKEFDFKSLKDKYEAIKIANDPQVNMKKVSPTAMREMYRDAAKNTTNDHDIKEKINKEVDNWDPEEDESEVLNAINRDFKEMQEKNKIEGEEEEEGEE